jgi:hypothetical protein
MELRDCLLREAGFFSLAALGDILVGNNDSFELESDPRLICDAFSMDISCSIGL